MTTAEQTAYNNGFILGMASKGVITTVEKVHEDILYNAAHNISTISGRNMTTAEQTAYNNGFILGMASKGVIIKVEKVHEYILSKAANNISTISGRNSIINANISSADYGIGNKVNCCATIFGSYLTSNQTCSGFKLIINSVEYTPDEALTMGLISNVFIVNGYVAGYKTNNEDILLDYINTENTGVLQSNLIVGSVYSNPENILNGGTFSGTSYPSINLFFRLVSGTLNGFAVTMSRGANNGHDGLLLYTSYLTA